MDTGFKSFMQLTTRLLTNRTPLGAIFAAELAPWMRSVRQQNR